MLQEINDLLDQCLIIKIHPGKVHGNRNDFQSLLISAADIGTYLLEYITVKFGNGTILLQLRHKDPRGDKSLLRMDPADQSLRRHDLACHRIYDRLIVDFQFFVCDRFLKFCCDLCIVNICHIHIMVKNRIWLEIFIHNVLLRKFGTVDHSGNRHRLVLKIKDTASAVHTDLLIADIKNLITEICQLLSGNPVTLYKAHKVVCFDPAHIDRFQERLLYLIIEAVQDMVAFLDSK